MLKTFWARLWALLCAPYDAWQAERALAREHQLALVREIVKGVEALTDGQVEQAREQARALIEVARANSAQAEAFGNWLKSFTVAAAPTSSVVSEDDEWAAEQAKLASQYGLTPDMADHLPEEFKLAHQLQQGFKDYLSTDLNG